MSEVEIDAAAGKLFPSFPELAKFADAPYQAHGAQGSRLSRSLRRAVAGVRGNVADGLEDLKRQHDLDGYPSLAEMRQRLMSEVLVWPTDRALAVAMTGAPSKAPQMGRYFDFAREAVEAIGEELKVDLGAAAFHSTLAAAQIRQFFSRTIREAKVSREVAKFFGAGAKATPEGAGGLATMWKLARRAVLASAIAAVSISAVAPAIAGSHWHARPSSTPSLSFSVPGLSFSAQMSDPQDSAGAAPSFSIDVNPGAQQDYRSQQGFGGVDMGSLFGQILSNAQARQNGDNFVPPIVDESRLPPAARASLPRSSAPYEFPIGMTPTRDATPLPITEFFNGQVPAAFQTARSNFVENWPSPEFLRVAMTTIERALGNHDAAAMHLAHALEAFDACRKNSVPCRVDTAFLSLDAGLGRFLIADGPDAQITADDDPVAIEQSGQLYVWSLDSTFPVKTTYDRIRVSYVYDRFDSFPVRPSEDLSADDPTTEYEPSGFSIG